MNHRRHQAKVERPLQHPHRRRVGDVCVQLEGRVVDEQRGDRQPADEEGAHDDAEDLRQLDLALLVDEQERTVVRQRADDASLPRDARGAPNVHEKRRVHEHHDGEADVVVGGAGDDVALSERRERHGALRVVAPARRVRRAVAVLGRTVPAEDGRQHEDGDGEEPGEPDQHHRVARTKYPLVRATVLNFHVSVCDV